MNFRLGYVTSIHKSQGSEYKVVIIIMLNEYSRMLYRKLIYTGITRAAKCVILMGSQDKVYFMIDNNQKERRDTALKQRIIERANIEG